MNTISFMTANYVARQVAYNMTEGWGQGDSASQAYFKPKKTFGERFEKYLRDIQDMGFDTIDIWTGVLHPNWASDDHISDAASLIQEYGFTVASLAGGFGANADELEASCNLAAELGAPILGGGTPLLKHDRELLVTMCQKYGLKFGLENHPEKTPEELLAQIGKGDEDVIGLCVDTGWWGTNGYPAPQALEILAPRLFHLHLKDVKAVGGHETCGYGEGVVQIEECVKTLKRLGYTGAISVEHEPEHFDPTDDCIASLALLKQWLA